MLPEPADGAPVGLRNLARGRAEPAAPAPHALANLRDLPREPTR